MDYKVTVVFVVIISLINGSRCIQDCIRHCFCEKKDGMFTVDCRGMNFTEVPQPNPEYPVSILQLQYNRITRMRMGEMVMYSKLEELYIQGNRMDTIEVGAFDGLVSLEKLDISKNMLQKIPGVEVKKLQNVKWLSMAMNGLRRIPEGIANLTNLLELDLSNNLFINGIPQGSLPPSLTMLDMRSTGVKTFKKTSFDNLHNLKTLLLADNRASASVRFEDGVFDGLAALEYIDLSRCFLRRLPTNSFTRLSNLTTLRLNNCWLKRIPDFAKTGLGKTRKRRSGQNNTSDDVVAKNGPVYRLNIASVTSTLTLAGPVQIETAPPSGEIWYNPRLALLDLSNNPQLDISKQDVRFPASLLDLRLGNTVLPTLNDDLFNETKQIQKLDLCNSRIKSISRDAFMKFRNVSEICLSGNPLTWAPRLPTSLMSLNLSQTRITNLTRIILDGLSHVVDANVRSGNIEWIGDDAFGSMTSLRVLDLSDNKIDTLTAKSLRIGDFGDNFATYKHSVTRRETRRTTGVVRGRSGLVDLDLSNNLLRFIERGSFATHGNLQNLNLQSNSLPSLQPGILAGLESLTALDVSNNAVTSIVPKVFAELANLKLLDLSRNSLEDILEDTFFGLLALKRLNLERNGIAIFHPFVSQSLEYLDISQNNLTSFPAFRGLVLKEIIASKNPIEDIPLGSLDGLPSLRNLDLSDCNIPYLNYSVFDSTLRLQTLSLRGNYIIRFLDWNIPSLKILSLAENEIQTIETNLNNVLPNLKRLDLQYNNISYLDPEVFSNSTMRELGLAGNNLQCNCDLRPLVNWIEKNLDTGEVEVTDADSYLCEGPPDLYTVPVLVAVAELNCDKPPKPPEPQKAEMFIGIGIAGFLLILVFLMLTWVFILNPRTRRRRSENGGPMANENGGQEVIMAPDGCCIPCKKWWLSVNYKRDGGHRGRIVSDERRDLTVTSPVTSPMNSEPPTSL